MINSLSISKFRGIEQGRVENLSQTNVFIGKNNSGKSTLFDLLCVIKAALEYRNHLGENVLASLLDRRVRRNAPNEIAFFHNYLPGSTIDFVAEFDDGPDVRFGVVRKQDGGLVYTLKNPDSPDDTLAKISTGARSTLYVESRWGNSGSEHALDYLTRQCTDRPESDNAARVVKSDGMQRNLRFMSNIVLVDADSVRKIERIEEAYWASIIKRRSDKRLSVILNQTYNTSIEGFTFAPHLGSNMKVFSLLPDISMHIDDYGDGFRYAFAILSIASQVNDTALLLEEPEVHQHEGTFRSFFEALNKIALENKLQVFVSTHSTNLVKTWTQVTKEIGIFHLTLDTSGQLSARRIEGTDVTLMLDLGVNPLTLDWPFSYLVVEGKEDAAFLEAVARKLKKKNLKELGYQIVTSPKDEQKASLCAFASTGNTICMCMDYDRKTKTEDLVRPLIQSLENRYKIVEHENEVEVKDTSSSIRFVPLGLVDDKDLSEAGIIDHSIEDYILKMLCVDMNLRKWAGKDLKNLKESAGSLKDKNNLSSSKTLLMTLGVLKGGKTLEQLIPEAIENSDPKSLETVLGPVIVKLFET